MKRKTNFMKIKQLALTYKSKNGVIHAIQDISLNLKKGEIVSIVGPSGCGKTTLLKLCAGLIEPTRGTIEGINSQKSSIVFQQPVLLPWKTVEQNVLLPSKITGNVVMDHVKLLEMMDLNNFSKSYPFELSGGMQQRVAIARSLIQDPSVIFMDEPFSALDEQMREKLNIELLNMWSQLKPTIIFVTHSISEAVLLSDRVIMLSDRPATVKKEIRIDIPRPRSLDQRDTEKFSEYVKCIRQELN